MSVNYKTADNLPTIDSLTDNTYGIVEESGQLKRIKGSELGSSIKTVGITVTIGGNGFESATSTMSFEEAYSIIHGGGFLQSIFRIAYSDRNDTLTTMTIILDDNIEPYSVPCLTCEIYFDSSSAPSTIYWTADGISTNPPSSGGPK